MKPHPFFPLLLRKLMPTRKGRGKGKEEDRHHLLTRRRSTATISSTRVVAIKVINVSTVILRKSMMPK